MLRFRSDFCTDKEVNRQIKSHICSRIIAIMQEDLDAFEMAGVNDVNHPVFIDAVCHYFPARYPKRKAAKAYMELYTLLTDKAEMTPKPLLEYAMRTMIRAETDRARLCGKQTVEPIGNRNQVKQALLLDCKKLYGTCTIEEAEGHVEKVLKQIEDMDEYEETCSWSEDFGLLDYFIDSAMEYKTYAEMYERELEDIVLTDPPALAK